MCRKQNPAYRLTAFFNRSLTKNMIGKFRNSINWLIHFITYDIWRIRDEEHTNWKKANLFNFLKIFILAIRNLINQNIGVKAAALTYSTVLAIVPILAILFAIARGFGFQNIVQSEFLSFLQARKQP